MNAISSTRMARFGSRLDIQRPDCPCCLNCQYGGMTRFGADEKVAISPVVRSALGICLPAYFTNAGLYSNVSIWLTPPSMNRKMQLLALHAWCGGRGAIGFAGSFDAWADSAASMSTSANPPNPR